MVLTAAAIAGTLAGACGDGSGPAGGPRPRSVDIGGEQVEVSVLTGAVDGLCTARRLATGHDLAGARAAFYDRSHETLHAVARGLESRDRARAARLLEAKQRVEADLQGAGTTTPGLPDDLTALVSATRDGLDRLGIATEDCAR